MFNDNQNEFTLGRSLVGSPYDKIVNLLECRMNVDTLYLDFAKAFDKRLTMQFFSKDYLYLVREERC